MLHCSPIRTAWELPGWGFSDRPLPQPQFFLSTPSLVSSEAGVKAFSLLVLSISAYVSAFMCVFRARQPPLSTNHTSSRHTQMCSDGSMCGFAVWRGRLFLHNAPPWEGVPCKDKEGTWDHPRWIMAAAVGTWPTERRIMSVCTKQELSLFCVRTNT